MHNYLSLAEISQREMSELGEISSPEPSPTEPSPTKPSSTESCPTVPCPTAPAQHEITIMLIGKTKAGKSTLRDNVLDEQNSELEAVSLNAVDKIKTIHQHGITLNIYTIGLEPHKGSHLLKKLSSDTKGQADLVILCVPVSPSNKFIDRTPDIMRELQGVFGKDIWRRCIIALTFSNLAWDRCEKKSPAPVDAYKEYITAYGKEIQKEFSKLGVHDVVVTTPFNPQPAEEGKFQVVAVPVGDDLDDEVLPGVQLNKVETWMGFFFLQMINNCSREKQKDLLMYRYGSPSNVRQMLKSMGYHAVAGAAVGAVVGGLEGATAGAAIGTLHGGLTTGALLSVRAAMDALWHFFSNQS